MPRELNNVLSKIEKFHALLHGEERKQIWDIRKDTNWGKQMHENPNPVQYNTEAHRRASYLLANHRYCIFSVTILKWNKFQRTAVMLMPVMKKSWGNRLRFNIYF